MTWFTRLCRNAGLTIHHIVKPVQADTQKRELSRKVEQKQISPTVTLRRTTIEEVEFRPDVRDNEK